jgi:hypothetical protein
MQTKLAGNSINACTTVESVANANLAIGQSEMRVLPARVIQQSLLRIHNLQPRRESTHGTHLNYPAIKIAPQEAPGAVIMENPGKTTAKNP